MEFDQMTLNCLYGQMVFRDIAVKSFKLFGICYSEIVSLVLRTDLHYKSTKIHLPSKTATDASVSAYWQVSGTLATTEAARSKADGGSTAAKHPIRPAPKVRCNPPLPLQGGE